MRYIRSVIEQDLSIAVDDVVTADLPVNPLSHLNLTLRFLNLAAAEATRAEILGLITRIEILFRGGAIQSYSLADLDALSSILLGNNPIISNQVATINAARSYSTIIPLGRQLYDPNEAFPGTKRGEFQIRITFASAFTAITSVTLQLESTELMGATPKRFLKATTLTQTMASGVENDVDLPIGNVYAGLLLFSTTVPTGTVFTTTADKIRFLINNVEHNIAQANWESLHGDLLSRIGHREAYDGSIDDDDYSNYALAEFSPGGRDDFLVETKGASSVVLKVNAGDANAVRTLPLELVDAASIK